MATPTAPRLRKAMQCVGFRPRGLMLVGQPVNLDTRQRHNVTSTAGLAYSYHFTFSAATVALKYHSKFQNRPDHLGTVLANTMGILSVPKRCNEPELRVVSRVLQ